MFAAGTLNDSGGEIKVKKVLIPYEGKHITALLYLPGSIDEAVPGVVLAHGISNSKETMSGIALELCKRGIAALSVDLVGHGGSGGSFGAQDPGFGMVEALLFFKSLTEVDGERVGVAGHSLGAGAARYTALKNSVAAVVLIGGGVGGMSETPVYGKLNASTPPNLLVAVGKNDVLYTYDTLTAELGRVFPEQIIIGELSGSFSDGSARKLVMPSTIHLLEPLTPAIVNEAVNWFESALLGEAGKLKTVYKPTYYVREVLIVIAVISFTALVMPLSSYLQPYEEKRRVKKQGSVVMITWAGMGLTLFFPLMLVGSLIPVPPAVFGSSLSWWLMLWGLAGITMLYHRNRGTVKDLRKLSDPGDLSSGLLIFFVMYMVASVLELWTGMSLRMVVPLFRSLSPLRRAGIMPLFTPFFYIHFASEHLVFERIGYRLKDILVAKTGGFILLLFLQYGGMYFLGVRLLPGFIGFPVEFLVAIMPLFILTTVYSWWFWEKKGRPGVGVALNTLLISWVSAGLFPLGSL